MTTPEHLAATRSDQFTLPSVMLATVIHHPKFQHAEIKGRTNYELRTSGLPNVTSLPYLAVTSKRRCDGARVVFTSCHIKRSRQIVGEVKLIVPFLDVREPLKLVAYFSLI